MTVNNPVPIELRSSNILVVDDQPLNVRLLEALLSKWGFESVTGLTDPSRVAELVRAEPPDLVMLDLHMPGLSGLDVMRLLEPVSDPSTPVPILVLTADSTVETKRQALAAGASDFLTKPFDSEEVRLRVSNLLRTRRLETQLKRHGDELEERVHERTKALEQAKLEIAERLAMAAEYRDDETHQHAQRIGHTAALLGARLGLSATAIADLRRAAPLHDIGKIAIPDTILLKPGRLTAEEFEIIKTHTVVGARILSGSSSRLLQIASEVALSHHEKWDGTGYPRGLSGDEIPVTGRIVALADVFDALTHRRPYKEAWATETAAEEIRRSAGTHFDPDVVAAFASLDHHRLVSPEHIDDAASVLPPHVTGPNRRTHREHVRKIQHIMAQSNGRQAS
ncbi:MAG TPA: HD domain-containing phosphohydrolase [Solirubrobacteraceae bacterium]|nr:HD domain-containing phosphohydrolase [Solirubrobacteraceae bacterium]